MSRDTAYQTERSYIKLHTQLTARLLGKDKDKEDKPLPTINSLYSQIKANKPNVDNDNREITNMMMDMLTNTW